jgi:biopolymer transport protein ExbB/TolQ
MSNKRKKGFFRGIDPSFVLGALFTAALYMFVLQPSMKGTLLRLYTTEHAVDYVIVALFVWGLTDIGLKMLAFPKQFLALRQEWIPPRKGREPAAAAAKLLERVRMAPPWLQETKVCRRVATALEYVTEKGVAEDYREYLQYLAEQDDNATHANYMLVRFVTGVTPLLGFLGTVVHFGTALSGISFEEMTKRLPVIVSEMGAAFNTTTVALGAAMSMTVFLFICERIERSIDRTVDRLIDQELLHRFIAQDPNLTPLISSVQSASEVALKEVGSHVERQTEIWSQAVDTMLDRFDARQKQEGEAWSAALDLLQQRHEEYDTVREQRMKQVLQEIESRQDEHLAHIGKTLQQAMAVRDEFAELTEALADVARGEGRIADVQAALSDNIKMLRETQKFDEALHGLTAAIHLLTARHGTSHLKVA